MDVLIKNVEEDDQQIRAKVNQNCTELQEVILMNCLKKIKQ